MIREKTVIVRHFPEAFTGWARKRFFNEVKGHLDMDRPCVVLECSQLAQMDKHIVLMLLRCLEEAMKRNGDVRLAAVSPQAKAALKSTGADILFRFFETSEDAIASFQRRTILPNSRNDSAQASKPAA